MMSFRLALVSALVAAVSATEWEWSEAFATADSSHTWIMQKVHGHFENGVWGGEYADATMILVVIPTTSPAKETVDALEATADTLGEGSCPTMNPGSTLTIAAAGSCFTLAVDDTINDSTWPMDTTGLTGVAMYAQHVPTEFERDMHYFKDSAGEDIEPIAYTKRLGGAMGATILVAIVTFVGVILAVPVVSGIYKKYPDVFAALANAFAAGALIAAAFFLLLFEGSHLVGDVDPKPPEATTSFLWGTMVLLGCITAAIFDLIITAIRGSASEGELPTKDGEPVVATKEKQGRVLSAVLLGDFMHNFCDGIFIGTAFSQCSDALAWNITMATVAHEIAQEIADYIVLTDPAQGNLKPVKALALNFLSGLSVIIGALVMLSIDEMNQQSLGMILTFGGGVYLQIGLAECMARVYGSAKTGPVKAASILAFCLGALAIGLVLLDHKHCTAGGAAHAHRR